MTIEHTVATEDELDALQSLHSRIVDTLAGFDKMVETAEPSFRPTAQAFQNLHARHEREVARLMTEAGRAADGDGSFMGTVNRVVVATRALFDTIDADVMQQIRSGEQHMLDAFDEAIGHTADSQRVAHLQTMRREVQEQIAQPHLRG